MAAWSYLNAVNNFKDVISFRSPLEFLMLNKDTKVSDLTSKIENIYKC